MFRPGGSASLSLFSWILTLTLSPEVRGQVLVLGAPAPVRARVGGQVVLPCHCEPNTDLRTLTVEWSRTELQPDPADRKRRVRYVHLHTDHSDDDLDMKLQAFMNRTQLFLEDMGVGVASLLIRNVTLSDNGTYKCFIPNLRTEQELQWTHVTLIVDEDKANEATTPSGRNHVIKISVFTTLMVFVILLAAYIMKTVKKLPMEKKRPLQNVEARGSKDSEVKEDEAAPLTPESEQKLLQSLA